MEEHRFRLDEGMFKLVWYEGSGSPACVAYASEYEVCDGMLFFYAEKPIVLSKEVRFIVK